MKELILVPTPIQDDTPLETVAREKLLNDCLKDDVLILVEEHKVARKKWLLWGLPREAIDKFIVFNEHSQDKIRKDILSELKSGKKAYLMSDGGLPAFCDPGQKLVDACHRQKIKVTATPFPNSIALAVSLSGFSHEQFVFSGFIPVKEPERQTWMKQELKRPETLIWMETPYRMMKTLEDLKRLSIKRDVFLAIDLGGESELLLRGSVEEVMAALEGPSKREFVLLVAPQQSK